MLKSESDDDDDDESSRSDSSIDDTSQIKGAHVPAKVPLSTSVVLERLPLQKQVQLNKTIEVADSKVTIRFQPIGSTPAIHPRVFKISSDQVISTLVKFLNKKLRHTGALHLYVQNSFSPNPDELVRDLYDLFKTNNELIISYCFTVAFG